MKLYEIAPAPPTMFPMGGQVEPNVMLSIANIMRRGGKNVNHFEYMVVARLIQMLKTGQFYKQDNSLFHPFSTSKEILDLLRDMPPAEIASIAGRLWELLQIKDQDKLYALANPTQEYLTYMKWLHSREADD